MFLLLDMTSQQLISQQLISQQLISQQFDFTTFALVEPLPSFKYSAVCISGFPHVENWWNGRVFEIGQEFHAFNYVIECDFFLFCDDCGPSFDFKLVWKNQHPVRLSEIWFCKCCEDKLNLSVTKVVKVCLLALKR